MDTDRLKYYCTIVETGSLTKAAELHRTTHSALSKSMSVLQKQQSKVFLRSSGKGITVTQEGRLFYQKAKQFLDLEGRLFHLATEDKNEILRIGSVEVFLDLLVAGFKDYGLEKNRVELLDLSAGDIEQKILAGELDFGITYAPHPCEGVTITKIGKYKSCCFHLSGKFTGHSLDEIPFVVPATGLSTNPLNIHERDGWHEGLFQRNKQYFVNCFTTAVAMALEGHCMIFMPEFFVKTLNKNLPKEKQLVKYRLPTGLSERTQEVYLLTHESRHEDTTYKKIAALMRKGLSHF